MITDKSIAQTVEENVSAALEEDIGSGDITASLISEGSLAAAKVITRERAVVAGTRWFDEVFKQVNSAVEVQWFVEDGEIAKPNQTLVTLSGPARALLTGERCALNFLQTLSGTATICRRYADIVSGTPVKLLDTRKTIPGLRVAQKYAVTLGGCHNHRIGLYDAFLIKENHIAACGSIARAVERARSLEPEKPVEVEVESLDEFSQALQAGCDQIMLDNFSLSDMETAVRISDGDVMLEASGGINENTLLPIAKTGVDYISIGALTKDCRAIDLSMRLD